MLNYICFSMKRKITVLTILLSLVAISSVIAIANYSYFTARSDGDSVILQWKTTYEDNLEKFGIERRTVNNPVFTTLDFVNAMGTNYPYEYKDKNIYKTTGDIYIYRIAFYDKNNSNPAYSNEVSVTHDLSSVKRTWGSIKAMFR